MTPLMTRRRALALGAAALCTPAIPALAAPIAYRLNASRSNVGFGVQLSGDTLTGSMPVRSADMALDFNQVVNSRVSVTLDAANTSMGVFFATDAVRSADLLDTARHPTITFRSTAVRQGSSAAEALVSGNVTIKGVTAPVTLTTLLTQDRATLGQDNPELVMVLRGSVNRETFGITAYKALVGPRVDLDIRAAIQRA
jgi:polyisoprenoid-binding protein YceI